MYVVARRKHSGISDSPLGVSVESVRKKSSLASLEADFWVSLLVLQTTTLDNLILVYIMYYSTVKVW